MRVGAVVKAGDHAITAWTMDEFLEHAANGRPHKLFDAIQQRLAELRPPTSGKPRAVQDAPYAGLLFDETGAPMLPTYTVKRGGVRYRYYASRPALKGERSAASISRIPAPPFEAIVSRAIGRLGLDAHAAIGRIDVLADRVVVRLKRDADKDFMANARALLADGESIEADGQTVVVTLSVRAKFRGGLPRCARRPDHRKLRCDRTWR